jgi:PAS domain-containing protein
VRILPYRTTDNSIAGVVLTFLDISEQERIKISLSYAEAVIETLFQPVIVLDKDLKVVSANRAFYELFRTDRKEAENKSLYQLDGNQWNVPELKKLLEQILPGQTEVRDYIIEGEFGRAGRLKLCINARRLQEKDGQRILMVIENMTDKKEEG